jgi:hypothetical protein
MMKCKLTDFQAPTTHCKYPCFDVAVGRVCSNDPERAMSVVA